jgi:hypothetical protein
LSCTSVDRQREQNKRHLIVARQRPINGDRGTAVELFGSNVFTSARAKAIQRGAATIISLVRVVVVNIMVVLVLVINIMVILVVVVVVVESLRD